MNRHLLNEELENHSKKVTKKPVTSDMKKKRAENDDDDVTLHDIIAFYEDSTRQKNFNVEKTKKKIIKKFSKLFNVYHDLDDKLF